MEIFLATKRDYPRLKNSLEKYIRNSEKYLAGKTYLDTKKVGNIIVNELENIENFPGMFFFYAEKEGKIVGMANGMFDEEYGLSYHTISYIRNIGIGTILFRKKVEYMLKKAEGVVAVKESENGIRLAKRVGFTETTEEIGDRLKLKGEKYFLKKEKYKGQI